MKILRIKQEAYKQSNPLAVFGYPAEVAAAVVFEPRYLIAHKDCFAENRVVLGQAADHILELAVVD